MTVQRRVVTWITRKIRVLVKRGGLRAEFGGGGVSV